VARDATVSALRLALEESAIDAADVGVEIRYLSGRRQVEQFAIWRNTDLHARKRCVEGRRRVSNHRRCRRLGEIIGGGNRTACEARAPGVGGPVRSRRSGAHDARSDRTRR